MWRSTRRGCEIKEGGGSNEEIEESEKEVRFWGQWNDTGRKRMYGEGI